MRTFAVSRSDGLLGSMVRALLAEVCPEALAADLPEATEDWGGVRVESLETGRWLCIFPESAVQIGVPAALTAGAASVLTINSGMSDFSRAVESLSKAGRMFVPGGLVQAMASGAIAARSQRQDGRRAASNESFVRLSGREREVLRLVAAGQSNTEIAQTLTISTNTVRSHLHALTVKLDASSRTRMLANARALGIAEASGVDTRDNPRESRFA